MEMPSLKSEGISTWYSLFALAGCITAIAFGGEGDPAERFAGPRRANGDEPVKNGRSKRKECNSARRRSARKATGILGKPHRPLEARSRSLSLGIQDDHAGERTFRICSL